MLLNWGLGRSLAAEVCASIRPAKLPAAFCVRSVLVCVESTNEAARTPLVTNAIDWPVTPAGQLEPEGLQPLATFDCIVRNCGRIREVSIWFASRLLCKR